MCEFVKQKHIRNQNKGILVAVIPTPVASLYRSVLALADFPLASVQTEKKAKKVLTCRVFGVSGF